MKRLFALLLAGAMLFSAAGCGSGAADAEAEAETELNIYMWEDYISADLISAFEEENNCTVNLSYMEHNEEAIAQLSAESDAYDLVMTCEAYMEYLIDGDYLKKINRENLPNSSTINESYWLSKKYSIPYLMNYIYVIYDSEKCPIEITGYHDLIDPALKGQIASVDGARNLFPMALLALGYDPNSTEESELAEAYEWLKQFDENVAAYGDAEKHLTAGDVSVAITYDGNASWAMHQKKSIRIAPFKEDAIQLGADLFVIPAKAKHVGLAEKFLNYICDPRVMAANLEKYPYSCPNDAAVAISSKTYQNDPARNFPYKENVFFQRGVGDAQELYDAYYQELMAGAKEQQD